MSMKSWGNIYNDIFNLLCDWGDNLLVMEMFKLTSNSSLVSYYINYNYIALSVFMWLILIYIFFIFCKFLQNVSDIFAKYLYRKNKRLYFEVVDFLLNDLKLNVVKMIRIFFHIRKIKVWLIIQKFTKKICALLYKESRRKLQALAYLVYALTDFYNTNKYGEVFMYYYLYFILMKPKDDTKHAKLYKRLCKYRYEVTHVYSYIFVDLILTFIYRSSYLWFITIRKFIFWSPVFLLCRFLKLFGITYYYIVIVFKIYYYFYKKYHYLVDVFGLWKLYNFFYNIYLSYIFYKIWVSSLVKLSYAKILRPNVWFDGKIREIPIELNYNDMSINWFKHLYKYDTNWYYTEYKLWVLLHWVQNINNLCKKYQIKLLGIFEKKESTKYLKKIWLYNKNIISNWDKENLLNIQIIILIISMLTYIFIKYLYVVILLFVLVTILYASYKLYLLDINKNYITIVLIYLILFYTFHVYLLLIVLLLKIIYYFRKAPMEKAWKFWYLKSLEQDKSINYNFVLNIWYCSLGYLIITLLNLLKKTILLFFKLFLFSVLAAILLKYNWIYSWFLSEAVLVTYEITLSLLSHLYWVTHINVPFIEITSMCTPIASTTSFIWSNHGFNLVTALEPYLHLMESSLNFFKMQDKILSILLRDGVYIVWQVTQAYLDILDYEFVYLGYFPKILWVNILKNIITTEVGFVSGFIILIASLISILFVHIKIKICVLILWVVLLANSTWDLMQILIIIWLDILLLKFRFMVFSLYFYSMSDFSIHWLVQYNSAWYCWYLYYVSNNIYHPIVFSISSIIVSISILLHQSELAYLWTPIYHIFDVLAYYKNIWLIIKYKLSLCLKPVYYTIVNILHCRFFIHSEEAVLRIIKSIIKSVLWLAQDLIPEPKTLKYLWCLEFTQGIDPTRKGLESVKLIALIWKNFIYILAYILICVKYALQKYTLLSNDLIMNII